MPLFFNVDNLDKNAKQDVREFLRLFRLLATSKLLPRHIKSKLVGDSFILNPIPLVQNQRTDSYYIYQYIKLAALREYSDYKLRGLAHLDLSMFPEVDRSLLAPNPLLNLSKHNLKFLYEEKDQHGNFIR